MSKWEEIEEAYEEAQKALITLRELDIEEDKLNRIVLDAFNNVVDATTKD